MAGSLPRGYSPPLACLKTPHLCQSSIAVANCRTCRLATAQFSGQKCDTGFTKLRSGCWEDVSLSKALGEEYLFSLPFQRQKLPSSLVSGPLFITSQHRQVKAFLHDIALVSSATSIIYFEGRAFLQSVWCYSNSEPCGWVIYSGHAFIRHVPLEAGRCKVREPLW